MKEKKLLAGILIITMLLSATACSGGKSSKTETTGSGKTVDGKR